MSQIPDGYRPVVGDEVPTACMVNGKLYTLKGDTLERVETFTGFDYRLRYLLDSWTELISWHEMVSVFGATFFIEQEPLTFEFEARVSEFDDESNAAIDYITLADRSLKTPKSIKGKTFRVTLVEVPE